MIQSDLFIKLINFDNAKTFTDEEPEVRCSVKGSLDQLKYKSPEMARFDAYDKTVDWWALGIIIYEMLTGYTPFDGECCSDIVNNIRQKQVELVG